MVGVFACGIVADRYGRKWTMMLSLATVISIFLMSSPLHLRIAALAACGQFPHLLPLRVLLAVDVRPLRRGRLHSLHEHLHLRLHCGELRREVSHDVREWATLRFPTSDIALSSLQQPASSSGLWVRSPWPWSSTSSQTWTLWSGSSLLPAPSSSPCTGSCQSRQGRQAYLNRSAMMKSV